MTFFKPLEGSVLLSAQGAYFEASLVEHETQVYAKQGGKYIRLSDHGRTSKAKTFWKSIQLDQDYHFRMGNMEILKPLLTVVPSAKAK